ncbi:MAG: TetR/AcrR family transcriptional regulator [bacterium]|nr:TetR/AcrR family transcriptional regulator [bacterium]
MTDQPQLSRKEREAAQHRCEILAVAVHLFAEHSYHETTMQMVAEAAEFSVGYLYKHFQGKEEMYEAMVRFHMATLDEIIETVENEHLPPLTELRKTFEVVCQHFNNHRDFMRIYHGRLDVGLDDINRRKQEHVEMTADLIAAAIAEGTLREVDPKLLATVVNGATEGLFHELAETRTERPFDDLTDTVFQLVIDPLRISQ